VSSLVKNIARFVLFLLIQVFVLNKIPPIHQFIVPYLYFLFILWLPFSINRLALLIIGFGYGLCLDYLTGYLGLHALPCTVIAYLRPFLLNILIPQDATGQSYQEPGLKSMGFAPYTLYVVLFTFIHHTVLVMVEWLQFGSFLFFLGKVAATSAMSIVLIFITEMLLFRKAKFKTNAAV
jgi:hypothetical protein